jgi:hypothetical protein
MRDIIGKTVWTVFGNTLRFGTVVDTRSDGGWLFVKCEWVQDEKYEKQVQMVCSLRRTERIEEWNRIDKIHEFDSEKLKEKLKELTTETSYFYYSGNMFDGSDIFKKNDIFKKKLI